MGALSSLVLAAKSGLCLAGQADGTLRLGLQLILVLGLVLRLHLCLILYDGQKVRRLRLLYTAADPMARQTLS